MAYEVWRRMNNYGDTGRAAEFMVMDFTRNQSHWFFSESDAVYFKKQSEERDEHERQERLLDEDRAASLEGGE